MIIELGKVSVFQGLSDEMLGKIAKFSKERALHAGEILIAEHDKAGADLYVLCEGSVEVVSNSSTITSNEVALSRLDKDIFGEVGWLCAGSRSATVRAIDKVEVIQIDGDKLKQMIFDNPEMGLALTFKIAQTLAERLTNTDSLLKQVLWNTGL